MCRGKTEKKPYHIDENVIPHRREIKSLYRLTVTSASQGRRTREEGPHCRPVVGTELRVYPVYPRLTDLRTASLPEKV